jgi:hypothetical protein
MLHEGGAGTLPSVRASRYKVVAALTTSYLVVLVLLAFVPWKHGAQCPWYVSVLCLVPVGALFTLLLGRRRWVFAAAFGVLGVAWIEAAQAIWMPEGYGRVEDTLWGSAGVLIGAIAVVLIARFMRSHNFFRIVTEGGHREIPQD